MEQRPRSGVRERVTMGLTAVGVAAALAGAVLVAWPRAVGRGEEAAKVAVNANVAATALPVAAMSRFVEHFCPLVSPGVQSGTVVVPSPIRGWSRLQDAVRCFTIDYPTGWRMEDDQGAVHLWSPDTDREKENAGYWDADFSLVRQDSTADDEAAEYEQFSQKPGVRNVGRGVLVGPWESSVNGDGTSSLRVFQERRVFSGRGEFVLYAGSLPADAAKKALLEKIADTFTAQ